MVPARFVPTSCFLEFLFFGNLKCLTHTASTSFPNNHIAKCTRADLVAKRRPVQLNTQDRRHIQVFPHTSTRAGLTAKRPAAQINVQADRDAGHNFTQSISRLI